MVQRLIDFMFMNAMNFMCDYVVIALEVNGANKKWWWTGGTTVIGSCLGLGLGTEC